MLTSARWVLLSLAPLLSTASRAELAAQGLFPAEGASDVCADTNFRLTFSQPVTLGKTGSWRIFKTAGDMLVDSIDLGVSTVHRSIGGVSLQYQPVTLNGKEATVHPGNLKLGYDEEYYVIVDAGAFQDAQAHPSSTIGGKGSWRFRTRKHAPPTGSELTVAADGHGDFCTVQGAVDRLPDGNTNPVVISILNSRHEDLVYIRGKHHITLRGQDRDKTVLACLNNNVLNTGSPLRGVVGVKANDFVAENLTLQNTTPYKGSQAESLMVDGQRCVLKHCNFLSYCDTVQLSGRVYVYDCYIEGNADFIWGKGTVYFDRCEIKANKPGYYVQSRNTDQNLGYIFVDCTLTKKQDRCNQVLARIDAAQYPYSQAAFINCKMDDHIVPAGWTIAGTDTHNLRFGEYRSTDLAGKPLDVPNRHPVSKQLSTAEAAQLRNPDLVLRGKDGWRPGNEVGEVASPQAKANPQ